MTALPLPAPPVFIWSLLAGGLGAIWFLAFDRFFGIISLPLAGVILLSFVGQGPGGPADHRPLMSSANSPRVRGYKIDKVPDWVIGRYRRYELFHPHEWIQTGIAALGLSFFSWVGLAALRPRRRQRDGSDNSRPGTS